MWGRASCFYTLLTANTSTNSSDCGASLVQARTVETATPYGKRPLAVPGVKRCVETPVPFLLMRSPGLETHEGRVWLPSTPNDGQIDTTGGERESDFLYHRRHADLPKHQKNEAE
ncbi:uncharacterized protein SCHCODRAFT_02635102 [Schizophyllum commune H4-8]|uniref:uncharacterized protein n=1 Tax=Schizophyllum commune (strain H4-8 / FGSC 9210) TaxID=578458 RepID=UPI00215F78F4|nr:uncharacterized protein SCHCODRAFT_02635102 [Schizophyllum commune H4-8]KAI5889617.1 hypothetical protein SCHCODRAFT_02635102 [Schizophyllum commune H4-8]